MTEELLTIAKFISETKPDEMESMNQNLYLAVGFGQRVGSLLNDAEFNYSRKREQCLSDLLGLEDETESIRKTKLDSWVAEEKRMVQNLKNLKTNLRTLQMALMQSIKSEREEKQMAGRGF